MKLLVDTNILIDDIQNREPFYAGARKLTMLGFMRELDLWASVSQVSDTFYILTNGGRKSLLDEANRAIKHMRKAVRICPLGESDVDSALDSPWDDLEDALVYQAARHINADAIITRDKEGFMRSSIKVFDCDELFAYLLREKGIDYEAMLL